MATILVVDDRETNRLLLRMLLGYRQHIVIEARDGEEALAVALEHKPDLIITDLLMPKVDGYEFLKNLRNNSVFARTPVIVYTATYVELEARELATRCGVFRVLFRPATPEDLLEAVGAALCSTTPEVEHALDDGFEIEHRRMLTNKLAQKVGELETEIARRQEGDHRLTAALSASGQRVIDWDLATSEITILSSDFGGGPPTVLQETYSRFMGSINPEDVGPLEQLILRARADRTSLCANFRHVPGTGVTRMMELRGQFHYDVHGVPVRMLGMVLDVTERVREESVHRLLAAIVLNSSDFISSARPDGTLTSINPAGTRMLGVTSADELIGKRFFDFVHPDSIPLVRESMPILAKLGRWRGEVHFQNSENGIPIPCECSAFTILDPTGRVGSIAVIARDIRASKEAQRQLITRLAQLTALRQIDFAISGVIDLQVTLQLVVDELLAMELVQTAGFFIYDPLVRRIDLVCGGGNADFQLFRPIAEVAIRERRITRCQSEDAVLAGEVREAFPMVAQGAVKGVLAVVYRTNGDADQPFGDFIETVANHAAVAVDRTRLLEALKRSKNDLAIAYDETLEGWSRALDLRDKETEGHSQRVTAFALRIARKMGVPEEELPHIRRGALLHDIGKVGVPDSILLKPGPLSPEEAAVMRRHTDYALDLLGPIAFLKPALDIPYCHHEKWDGTGYPRGLKGAQIPLAARMFAVADVYDALSSDRPYREAWTRARVVQYIHQGSGTHFDPAVVAAFLRVLNDA